MGEFVVRRKSIDHMRERRNLEQVGTSADSVEVRREDVEPEPPDQEG